MRVGFTGHQNLPPEFVSKIRHELWEQLRGDATGLTGLSSLAEGADQIFASTILSSGGALEVVIPSAGYQATFSEEALDGYKSLLSKASRVHQLPFNEPSEEAFFAAGKYVVDNSDRMIAVWDGEKAAGLGGTGDIVQYARDRGFNVTIIWPKDVVRD
ncbi:MAG: hypothetical protein ACREP9_09805 [Candidatus Dormibacteraceae bacterium]